MRQSNQFSVFGFQFSARKRAALGWVASVIFVLLVTTGLASGQEGAAPARGSGDVELYQALLDLQSPWTVMCIAAHPDDEDGATLTILRRKYGVHTVTVFSTY